MRAFLGQLQGVPSDPGPMLRMLEEQQVSLTVQLANAQQQLRELQMTAERSPESERARIQTFVVQNEARVAALKERLATVRDQIAQSQDAIGRDAAAPKVPVGVAVAQENWRIFGLTPTEFYSTGGFILLFPLVLALARRIWRGGTRRSADTASLEGSPQIARLEQAVEAIAIEVERISEAQRFSAKLLAERPVEAKTEDEAPRRAKRPVITPIP